MASAWGNSWGVYWGNSWGSVVTASVTASRSAGHGRARHQQKRSLWSIKHEGKYYAFETFAQLEAEYWRLQQKPHKKKRPKKPVIGVHVETVREARSIGITGLQKLADNHDFLNLRKYAEAIEASFYKEFLKRLDDEKRDDEDEELDFIVFQLMPTAKRLLPIGDEEESDFIMLQALL